MKRIFMGLFLFLCATSLAVGCAPLQEEGPKPTFLQVCKAKAREHGGKITKQQFVAQAQNKEKAEEVFDACDTNHQGYLTEQELFEPQRQRMIQNVIRLTQPPR